MDHSHAQVNRDIHEALAKVSELMGGGFRPKSLVAGFLSAANQKYLAEQENIHVCQGNTGAGSALITATATAPSVIPITRPPNTSANPPKAGRISLIA